MDSDLREARRSHGARETSLRQCGSLRRAGVLDARVSAGAEHAALCCVARGRLVRARQRTTRSQPTNPAALALHGPSIAPVSRFTKKVGTTRCAVRAPLRGVPTSYERIAITSEKIRSEQYLLGLWAGESARLAYSKFLEERRSRR